MKIQLNEKYMTNNFPLFSLISFIFRLLTRTTKEEKNRHNQSENRLTTPLCFDKFNFRIIQNFHRKTKF